MYKTSIKKAFTLPSSSHIPSPFLLSLSSLYTGAARGLNLLSTQGASSPSLSSGSEGPPPATLGILRARSAYSVSRAWCKAFSFLTLGLTKGREGRKEGVLALGALATTEGIKENQGAFEKEAYGLSLDITKCKSGLDHRLCVHRCTHREKKIRKYRGVHVPCYGSEEVYGQAKPQYSLHERPDDLLV